MELIVCWFCDVEMELLEDERQRCPECGVLVTIEDLIDEHIGDRVLFGSGAVPTTAGSQAAQDH